jgi:hypothetical protein
VKNSGVILLAHGKRGYGFAAVNMAFSIKQHSPDIQITLFHDDNTLTQVPEKYLTFIDNFVKLDDEFYETGRVEPGRAKLLAMDKSPYDNTLYLDVDGICLKDITPIFERLKGTPITCQQMGQGGFGDEDIKYDGWSNHDFTFPFFDLSPHTIWRTTQTSWFYVEKGTPLLLELFRYYDKRYPLEKLKYQWAGFIPDEIVWSGVMSKHNVELYGNDDIIYFGTDFIQHTEVVEKYFFLSLYGNGNGVTLVRPMYFDLYDRILHMDYSKHKMEHQFKCHFIMKDKILTR